MLNLYSIKLRQIIILKIKLKTILLICLSVIFQINAHSQNDYKVKKVVIDAGHGGKDPGALGKKSKEKDIALAIALKVGKYIDNNIEDVEVSYTRKTDVFVELFRRSEIANEKNADLFISIHVNSNKSKNPSGTATYIMGLHKMKENLEVAKTENSVILIEDDYKLKYEGYDPNSPETEIIMSLYQNTYLKQSTTFAAKIQEQFKNKAGRLDMGVRQAGLMVLWNCAMPSVLIETGFISNPAEEDYLRSDYGQSIIASAIFRAFRDYKTEIETKSKSTEIKNKKDKIENSTKKKENLNNNDSIVENITVKHNIVFKIQIKTSVNKIKLTPSNFKGLKDVSEYNENSKFKYMVGNSNSYKEISLLQIQVRKIYPDAFTIVFIDEKKSTLKEAFEKLKE